MATRRWQDSANLLLGLWLFVSPWMLAYDGTAAAHNAHAMGAGLMAFALLAAYMPKTWEEVINTLLGLWLVVSPFVLSYQQMPTVALHTVIVGILATSFATWAMFSDQAFYERWHPGMRG